MQGMFREIALGVCYATVVMMFEFSMNKGQILHWYYKLISKWHNKNTHWIKKSVAKMLGYCPVCFGLWFSYPAYLVIGGENYFYFLCASQFLLIVRYGD